MQALRAGTTARLVGEWKRGDIWYRSETDFEQAVSKADEFESILRRLNGVNLMGEYPVITGVDDYLGKSFRWFRHPRVIGSAEMHGSSVKSFGTAGFRGAAFVVVGPADTEELMAVVGRTEMPQGARMPSGGYWYETRGD